MTPRPQVWSNGGGVQSAAIAALIVRGDLPKPDAAVIADTGREASATWRYLEAVTGPALASVGVEVHRIGHEWATVDLWGGKDKKTLLIPAFTNRNGKSGKLNNGWCSGEWKKMPVRRYCKKALGMTGGADMWIGFSIDEMRRMSEDMPGLHWRNRYPLIDRRMARADCVALVQSMGWPDPPRSSCWMCPHRSLHEWAAVRDDDSQDWGSAIALDQEIRRLDPDVYLHRSLLPLAEAVDQAQADSQGDLFGCESGWCFT